MMSPEREDVVYYDSELNPRFRDALIDLVAIPAYLTALDKDAREDVPDNLIMVNCEQWLEGNRIEYDFSAEKGDPTIFISSTTHMAVPNLTLEGARLLHDEIKTSNVHNDTKERYMNRIDKLRTEAVVETFTRRTFQIELDGGDDSVSVETDIGYSIDGLEVFQSELEGETELDLERETVFEIDEIVEVVRALLALELISESDVKLFLNREF